MLSFTDIEENERELARRREAGDVVAVMRALEYLPAQYADQSRWEKAEECLLELLAMMRERADTYGEAKALLSLGDLYGRIERLAEAERYYRDSHVIACKTRNDDGKARALEALNRLYQRQSRWNESLDCLEQLEQLEWANPPTDRCFEPLKSEIDQVRKRIDPSYVPPRVSPFVLFRAPFVLICALGSLAIASTKDWVSRKIGR